MTSPLTDEDATLPLHELIHRILGAGQPLEQRDRTPLCQPQAPSAPSTII